MLRRNGGGDGAAAREIDECVVCTWMGWDGVIDWEGKRGVDGLVRSNVREGGEGSRQTCEDDAGEGGRLGRG